MKVERERLKTEEESMRLSENRGQLDRSLRDTECELDDCKKTIQVLLTSAVKHNHFVL